MGLLPDTQYCGLRMHRERRERFPRHRGVSDPGMQSRRMKHVPWCMSKSLTHSGRENVPSIPGAWATRNIAYLVRGPWPSCFTYCLVCFLWNKKFIIVTILYVISAITLRVSGGLLYLSAESLQCFGSMSRFLLWHISKHQTHTQLSSDNIMNGHAIIMCSLPVIEMPNNL